MSETVEKEVSPKGKTRGVPPNSEHENDDIEASKREIKSKEILDETGKEVLTEEATKKAEFQARGRERRERFLKRLIESYDNVKSSEGQNKLGSCGNPIPLTANYVRVQRKGQWRLYHYHVTFNPELTLTREKKGVMRQFGGIGKQLGQFIFDGSSLWTTVLLSPEIAAPIELIGELKDSSPIGISIKLVAEVEPGDVMYLQFYSIVIRKCLEIVKLCQMGRHYFDPEAAIALNAHRLELWPGFITTMRQHDAGLLYCIEITHKVLRMDNIFDRMTEIRQDIERNRGAGMDAVKEAIQSELVGTIVLTPYNNLTYRIDDIAWGENAMSTFLRGKEEVSYMDYFKEKYNVTIRSSRQPLLISNPKKSDIRRGHKTPFKLIPELCRMTGLSETLRSNFTLMRDMGRYLFQPPQEKVTAIKNFIQRLKSSPECQKEMNSWGLNLTTEFVTVEGRVIPREGILFREGRGNGVSVFDCNDKGDFTMAFRSNQMVHSVRLQKWVLIVPQRDAPSIENLINTMNNVAVPLGFDIEYPMEIYRINSANPATYVNAIDDLMGKYRSNLQLLFVILTNNNLETYSAVKKRCCVEYGIPSQCFLSKNVKSRGLMSIATKIVVQMNAKLGGQPWNIQIPLKGLMIVGFDVHKSGGSKRVMVGAMVCTISASYGRYYSTASFYSTLEDLAGNMAKDVTKCLFAWKKENNHLPARVMFYRGGVGEGQLHYVFNTELEAIKTCFRTLYTQAGLDEVPKLTYIICTKRINTRFFAETRHGYDNAPPGTVVDSMVTVPERWDFFLISHCGRQGTVTPTSYNVLWDRSQLDSDKIQRLTYKMCHFYYNWSGGISVPAVIQYAHKLAYITGLSLQGESHPNLSSLLYFL